MFENLECRNKIINGDSIVGYYFQDVSFDQMTCPIPVSAMYSEEYMVELKQLGYEFEDYQGTIKLPNGTYATELPSMPLSDVMQMYVDYWNAEQAEHPALSEDKAAKYITYKVDVMQIQFKEESSYQINTREEFIAYLEMQEKVIAEQGCSPDNRPINSFVNPKALFTIEEVADSEVGRYLEVISKRHVFESYPAYTRLLNYLKSKGVLTNSNPSDHEFLEAYYAWGPEGISSAVIDKKSKPSVDGRFMYNDSLAPSTEPVSYVTSNRDDCMGIITQDKHFRYLRNSIDMKAYYQFTDMERAVLTFGAEDVLRTAKRVQSDEKYVPFKGLVSDITPRLYFTIKSEVGFKYLYKVAPNKIGIYRDYKDYYYASKSFGFLSIVGQVIFPMSAIQTEADYYLWNRAYTMVASKIKETTVPAPFDSTVSMLRHIGMSTKSIIKWMAKRLRNLAAENRTNAVMLEEYPNLHVNPAEYLTNEIPNYVLEAFDLPDADTKDIATFFEVADPEQLKSLIGEDVEGNVQDLESLALTGDRNYKLYEQASKWYYNAKFCYDALQGSISAGYYIDGLRKDMTIPYEEYAGAIMSVVYEELGDNPDVVAGYNLIDKVFEDGYLTDKDFYGRDRARQMMLFDWLDALKDKVHTENTFAWCFVNTIFAELGNRPIDDLRAYYVKFFAVKNQGLDLVIRQALTEAVQGAIEESDVDEELMTNRCEFVPMKELLKDIAPYFAARLLFLVLISKAPLEEDLNLDIPLYEDKKLNVRIDSATRKLMRQALWDNGQAEAHCLYATVYDICDWECEEFSSQGTFRFHFVNARFTPWSVEPQAGFSIKKIQFYPSYYNKEQLEHRNGEEWYALALQNKQVNSQAIKELDGNAFFPTQDAEYILQVQEACDMCDTYEDFVDEIIPEDVWEAPQQYAARFQKLSSEAKQQNKIVEYMPLRADYKCALLADAEGLYTSDIPVLKDGESHVLDNTDAETVRFSGKLLTDTLGLPVEVVKCSSAELSSDLMLLVLQKYAGKSQIRIIRDVLCAGDYKCSTRRLGEDLEAFKKFIVDNCVLYNNTYYFLTVSSLYKVRFNR